MLARFACTRVIRKGALAVSRHDLPTVFMQSIVPMADTCEISLTTVVIGDMARHHGVTWGSPTTLGDGKAFHAQAWCEVDHARIGAHGGARDA